MKPLSASVRMVRLREDAFWFRDVLASHAQLTAQMQLDSPPDTAALDGKSPMRDNGLGELRMEMEVLDPLLPTATVKDAVAHGKGRTRGTCTLDELSHSATRSVR